MVGHPKGGWKVDNRDTPVGYESINLQDLPKDIFPYIINMPAPPFALGRAGAIITIDPMNPDGALANAYLMAAAPDMHRVLRHTETVLYNLKTSNLGELTQQQELLYKEVIEVLAKTEGGGKNGHLYPIEV